jgi:hypothetical protein
VRERTTDGVQELGKEELRSFSHDSRIASIK